MNTEQRPDIGGIFFNFFEHICIVIKVGEDSSDCWNTKTRKMEGYYNNAINTIRLNKDE